MKICCLLGIVAVLSTPLHAQNAFADDIRELTGIVKRRWAYLEHRQKISGLDLVQLEKDALRTVGTSEDPAVFARALRRYVSRLEDGHGWVTVSGEVRKPRRLPFTLADAAEGVIVHGVGIGTPKKDLRPGDVLLLIDGKPVEAALKEAAHEVCASTAGARRAGALFRLCSFTDRKSISVEVQRADGSKSRATLACPPTGTAIPTPMIPVWKRKETVIEKGIGYFRPGSFRPPADSGWSTARPEQRDEILKDSYTALRKTMERLRESRVLILDIRGNGGGTDLLGKELAGMLLPKKSVYYRLQARDADGSWRASFPSPVRSSPGFGPFGGALICLIDEGTFSTADNFAACLRDNHSDITFVGRPTGAGTGAPRPFTLTRTKVRVTFCTMRVFSPKGTMIEGTGVKPDVPVRWTRRDVLGPEDADLAKALELARRKIAR